MIPSLPYFYPNLTTLDLSFSTLQLETMSALATLKNLQDISFVETNLNDSLLNEFLTQSNASLTKFSARYLLCF